MQISSDLLAKTRRHDAIYIRHRLKHFFPRNPINHTINSLTLKSVSTQTDDVGNQLGHGHDDLKMDPDESSPLTKLEVASHQQVEKTAGFAPRRRQAGVATAKDLVAKSAAEQ